MNPAVLEPLAARYASWLRLPAAALKSSAGSEDEDPDDEDPERVRAMPVIPIFHDTWTYLEAPYLRGLKPNPFAAPQFKYAWIDTTWRPS